MGSSSQDLELLVEELTKSRPNFDKVKILSKKCGLRYHEDLTIQMQIVLNAVVQRTGTSVQAMQTTKVKNIEGV